MLLSIAICSCICVSVFLSLIVVVSFPDFPDFLFLSLIAIIISELFYVIIFESAVCF